ncbi:dihydroorotate dehydrogenase [Syntrophaceticus schinkii]|uniref:Dihydroorotate dehydrogenase n=1 Tax=Syntrophaceticus schinkii TaxID=499207 RepID=A0A0B7MNV1_9FIRM|nr:dihydroorotate dehydrogenase [Syntrophaceticus schinkii]MDD2359243.1 dihydroorotate dehydrogenase [Syntrophaceticus schinkii]MDD4261065.1 dihydroorotate dehydrogenase [Syntrophaceticus schinkii]MDD4674559.1 dihydroorotate dehydrogenase [Syntrophaceticus schinkii]CEO89392.1 dihydroorotate dehydrogenase (catalytic subunit) [Syntrophaceticus schinkii]
MADLAVDLAGIKMKNPVMSASGTFGSGVEYAGVFDVGMMGALVTTGLTLESKAGNRPPRLCETPAGLLNAVGLQNPGVDAFIRDILPGMLDFGVPVIANIAGSTKDEFVEIAEKFTGTGVAGLEINISCPNVKTGGMALGTIPEVAAQVVEAVIDSTDLPVIVKLTPNVTNIVELARAVADAGADALSLINTLLGMVIDVEQRKPVLGNIMGGLSGPAIRPIAVRAVWQVAQAIRIPIIGMGGICTGRDALEFMMAGASAVAVGSAFFHDPLSAVRIITELDEYCGEHGVDRLQDLVGSAWKE